MNQRNLFIQVLFGALVLTLLFHRQPPGINLWIAGVLFFGLIFLVHKKPKKSILLKTAVAGFIITSLAAVLVHSAFSGWMYAISVIILAGVLSVPDLQSLPGAIGTGICNLFLAPVMFLKRIKHLRIRGRAVGNYLWKGRIYLIPLLVIIVFLAIYRNSSPVFDKVLDRYLGWIGEWINMIFSNFNFDLAGTFFLCLVLSCLLLIRNELHFIANIDKTSEISLTRKRKKFFRSTLWMGLSDEHRAAIFLLAMLNVCILVLNITDIHWVWFNFEWEGQYLKQFVHEGTWLLIISIIISMAIVLWFFRGNLNFFPRNRILKILSYVWLSQNLILTISVAIRNLYYISYFSLAYKRIGVLIFLILVVSGLFTVFIKVIRKRSGFYLFKVNALTWFIVLVVSSSVPWDIVIARYNFSKAGDSFLHLNFLSTLSDKALPYLDVSADKLEKINKKQQEMFPFSRDGQYMSPEEYQRIIEKRKASFIARYRREGFLSRNLPEMLAYNKLTGNTGESP